MRVAVTGSTGLIGSRLVLFLTEQGHEVLRIPRAQMTGAAPLVSQDLEGLDVVIHLAGASIAGRWSEEYKQEILNSRLKGTSLLCAALAALQRKPKILLSASAVGYYGSHEAEHVLDEYSLKGRGFLADVCGRWEHETVVASDAGIRVVNMRFGTVLSKKGGALAKMLPAFRFGVGGVIGSGDQMMSWVALEEIPNIVLHLIDSDLSGPINIVSPHPVSNREFTETLGEVLGRPTFMPLPAFMVEMIFGEMGQKLLLEGSRVQPARLQRTQYHYYYPDLKTALEKAIS